MDTRIKTVRHQAYLITLSTRQKLDICPYSNSLDQGHNPGFTVQVEGNNLALICQDTFKLKPDSHTNRRFRSDIYLPQSSSLSLSDDIAARVGMGQIKETVPVDPVSARKGPRKLPGMGQTHQARYLALTMQVAGITIPTGPGKMLINLEKPDPSHTVMKVPAIHIGIILDVLDEDNISGAIDRSLVRIVKSEPAASGTLRLVLTVDHAKNLAAVLRLLGQQEVRS